MALYQFGQYLKQFNDTAFSSNLSPGTPAPFAGIYRCANCGHEIGIAEGHTLPPQIHPQHPQGLPILWCLLVFAEHHK